MANQSVTSRPETGASENATASPYHPLQVVEVTRETDDARSFTLEIPQPLRETFAYRAGQFLTFRVTVDEERLVRCYSLASSPDTDSAPKFTVKRVEDGRVSNRLNDSIEVGTTLEVMKPAGVFCLRERSTPISLFAGGSGITPVISILKTALSTTQRSLRLYYANRDENSVIFAAELADLAQRRPDRLEIIHRHDDVHGFANRAAILDHIGANTGDDFYICGPGGYMDVIEDAIAGLGISSDQIFIERFTSPQSAGAPVAEEAQSDASSERRVAIELDGKSFEIEVGVDETILAAALRAGLEPPFACEEGYCGCCMATLAEGEVAMKSNTALDESLLAQGWILTCQSVPKTAKCKIKYPD